ncbi:MAG: hypothetical protein H0T44_14005 [Gemmatimonadales bacterium]|nr:hypothetical protein [Gemmatimonadales bacterium]
MLALGAATGSGCGRASAPLPTTSPMVPAPAEACVLTAGEPGGLDTVSVGPLPFEGLLLRRLESPIRFDCLGQPRPGLATAWSSDSSGRSWTLVLAAGGVAAADLVSEWRARGATLSALQWAGVESMVPLDRRRLVVTLRRPSATVPTIFADPSLAVPTLGDGGVVLDLVSHRGDDPRDALDRGADLLQTDDPGVVEYAASRPDLLTVELPWSRIYLLLVPDGDPIELSIEADSAAFRAALARDAVRGAARAAEPPFWWEHPPACGSTPSPAAAGRQRVGGAIAYPLRDRTARELAERIVALSDGMTTKGLEEADLAPALHAGSERAYVISLARRVLVPCRELSGWPTGAIIVPLIDTRSSLIVRRGVPALTLEWDGSVRLEERR